MYCPAQPVTVIQELQAMNHAFPFYEMQETNEDCHAEEQQGVQTEQTKKQGQMATKMVPSTPTKEQSSRDKHNREDMPPASKTNKVKLHAPAPTTLKQKSYACTDEVQTLFTFF